jgi:RNA polymerase sigma factor (sigma-70 family)
MRNGREFERLIGPHVRPLRVYVDARIPDRFRDFIDADDVLQDAWIAAFDRLQPQRFANADHLNRWLLAIVRNKLTDSLRAVRRVKRGCDRLRAPGAHGLIRSGIDLLNPRMHAPRGPRRSASFKEAVAVVEQALSALPERQRLVLEMRFKSGLSAEQISARTDISTAGVHGLLFRGLRALRRAVGPRERLLSTRA